MSCAFCSFSEALIDRVQICLNLLNTNFLFIHLCGWSWFIQTETGFPAFQENKLPWFFVLLHRYVMASLLPLQPSFPHLMQTEIYSTYNVIQVYIIESSTHYVKGINFNTGLCAKTWKSTCLLTTFNFWANQNYLAFYWFEAFFSNLLTFPWLEKGK